MSARVSLFLWLIVLAVWVHVLTLPVRFPLVVSARVCVGSLCLSVDRAEVCGLACALFWFVGFFSRFSFVSVCGSLLDVGFFVLVFLMLVASCLLACLVIVVLFCCFRCSGACLFVGRCGCGFVVGVLAPICL